MKLKQFGTLLLATVFSLMMMTKSLAGNWHQDNDNWKYEDSGTYVKSSWMMDNNQWYYFDAQGIMQQGWLKIDQQWYFLESSGAMIANAIITIEGIQYNFDANGKLIETVTNGWNGNTYTNTGFDFSITVPNEYKNSKSEDENILFAVETSNSGIASIVFVLDSGQNINDFVSELNDLLLIGISDVIVSKQKSEASFGGYQYICFQNKFSNLGNVDFYYRQVDSNVLCFITMYQPSDALQVNHILKSVTMTN